MAIIESWLPPSREHWQLITTIFSFFPVVTLLQWALDWYPQGKTSVDSRFNIPGKLAWATMESPGFLILLYIMNTLPAKNGIEKLPLENWVMAALFVIHYLYRAVLAPVFLNPSMSPIHIIVWLGAFLFQVFNATSIGGWLASYGPTTKQDWAGREVAITIGLMVFALGLLGNVFHDDELREIRRAAARNQKRKEAEASDGKPKDVSKVYVVPENGLFHFILYPHFLLEWVEWCGFWLIGGLNCLPAQNFVLAELSTMTPRALQGKRWYVARFGKEKIGNRKAVIPGIL